MSFRSVRTWMTVVGVLGSMLAISPAPANDFPNYHGGPTDFVTVSDGISIALNVVPPTGGFVAGKQYPTIFEFGGYENGSSSASGRTLIGETEDYYEEYTGDQQSPPLTGDSHGGTSAFRYDADYVSVHGSVRGTGCSSGEFDLFSSRSARDGYEVIENWIIKQAWSNEKVGILGHSYSGITGFGVAATQPPHLTAITISGLIDDLYRGLTYPGGVSDYGFPVLWTVAIRNVYDVVGGSVQALARHQGDAIAQQCARNIATHRRTVVNDPGVQGINDTDNDWWRSRALTTYAPLINRPIHITGAYQDEQTGPRGPAHLWEMVSGPKRLLLTNGDHGTNVDPDEVWGDRKAWMDYWMRGLPNATVLDPDDRPSSVRTLFEMHVTPTGSVSNGVKDSTSFPLEDTTWTPFYLNAGGTLQTSDVGLVGSDRYVSAGPGRQSWSYQAGPTAGKQFTTPEGPDELTFKAAPFNSNVTVVGPMTANLFISSTAPDTELFVQVIDFNPADGSKTYLQRGLLKASHRAIDLSQSDYSGSFMYRPYRPHTNPTDITPNQTYEYLVEVFPVGHVFRAGHQLMIKVHTPPAVDSYYIYVPRRAPAVNTLFHDATHKSRITLPFVPFGGLTGPALACGQQEAVRCV
ncbi:MAG: CocE/NonD family hydrolase [Actinomycetota bacterium]